MNFDPFYDDAVTVVNCCQKIKSSNLYKIKTNYKKQRNKNEPVPSPVWLAMSNTQRTFYFIDLDLLFEEKKQERRKKMNALSPYKKLRDSESSTIDVVTFWMQI